MIKYSLITLLLSMPSLLTAISGDHLHQFMWANFDCFNNNSQRALKRYHNIKGQSVWTYHGYIPFLFKHGNYQEIVALAKMLDTHFPHDPSLHYFLALSLKKTGNITAYHERIIALNKKHPDSSEIALHAAHAYNDSDQKESALAVIETYLNKTAHTNNAFIFHFLKAQIYNHMNDTHKALKNIDLCLQNKPSYENAWLMKASLEEKKGSLQEAIEGYSRFLNLSGTTNNTIQTHITNLMLRQSGTPDKLLAKLSDNASDLDKAIAYFSENNNAQALLCTNHYLEKNPTSIQAKLLRIQIYMKNNNRSQALACLNEEINKDPENGLWYKTLYLLKNRGMPTKTITPLFKDLAKKYPKMIHPFLYTADLLLRTNRPTDAITYLQKAATLTPIVHQKALILYQEALILYQKKDHKQLAEIVQKIIEYDPQFFPAYNLLAYSLAQKKENFGQAHELIDSALRHDPENPHYRDTKGYIFYKQGNYPQAKKIFEELCIPCHTDTVITKHLAKTHYKKNKENNVEPSHKKLATAKHTKQRAPYSQKKT